MDYREIFTQVEKFLTERGNKWIVEQVYQELATGRISEERLGTLAEVASAQVPTRDRAQLRSSQSAEFVKRMDYSAEESLVLLLEAARRGILEPVAMANRLKMVLAEDGLTSVQFDRGGVDLETLSFSSLRNEEEVAGSLKALDEIIQEARGS